ncbi:hypothetical protein [Spirillospora sp. NPDC048819]|uniref:hypothetical protein n=1 Tax=Spirillospora sp. NPDC048819 TaxID=3155268 RepID=UPI00340DB6ED
MSAEHPKTGRSRYPCPDAALQPCGGGEREPAAAFRQHWPTSEMFDFGFAIGGRRSSGVHPLEAAPGPETEAPLTMFLLVRGLEVGRGGVEPPTFRFQKCQHSAAIPSTKVRRRPTCARGGRWLPSLSSGLSSPSGPSTSAFQPPDAPLVLAGAVSLGAVDEQRSRVGCQLVQFDLERVGVALDETGQGFPSCSTVPRRRT